MAAGEASVLIDYINRLGATNFDLDDSCNLRRLLVLVLPLPDAVAVVAAVLELVDDILAARAECPLPCRRPDDRLPRGPPLFGSLPPSLLSAPVAVVLVSLPLPPPPLPDGVVDDNVAARDERRPIVPAAAINRPVDKLPASSCSQHHQLISCVTDMIAMKMGVSILEVVYWLNH